GHDATTVPRARQTDATPNRVQSDLAEAAPSGWCCGRTRRPPLGASTACHWVGAEMICAGRPTRYRTERAVRRCTDGCAGGPPRNVLSGAGARPDAPACRRVAARRTGPAGRAGHGLGDLEAPVRAGERAGRP